jgi:hypothetical protein
MLISGKDLVTSTKHGLQLQLLPSTVSSSRVITGARSR